MTKFLTASVAIAMALTVSACDNKTASSRNDLPTSSQTTPGSGPTLGSPAAEAATDTATTAKVKAALLATDSISSTKISVETLDGRVKLKGNLPDRAMIDRVLSTVKNVPGVRDVDNQLVIGAG